MAIVGSLCAVALATAAPAVSASPTSSGHDETGQFELLREGGAAGRAPSRSRAPNRVDASRASGTTTRCAEDRADDAVIAARLGHWAIVDRGTRAVEHDDHVARLGTRRVARENPGSDPGCVPAATTSSRGNLPFTGLDVAWLVVVGLLLLVAGTSLVGLLESRRRRDGA